MTASSQHGFAAALMEPLLPAPAGLRAGSRRERERRFAVHRNNFVVNLVDALSDTFPVTHALVGDAFFRAMARQRVFSDPPRSPVLFEYAETFPDFISGFAPAASVAYLADVARIEALCVHAYHAADARPLPQSDYLALAADPQRLLSATVALPPACRWFRSRHAAHAIWSAHQGLADMARADLGTIDPDAGEDILATRPALEIEVTTLPGGGIEFLDALRARQPFGVAFARARAADPGVDASALFTILVRHGLAVGLDAAPEH